jgi:hypothetical protein
MRPLHVAGRNCVIFHEEGSGQQVQQVQRPGGNWGGMAGGGLTPLGRTAGVAWGPGVKERQRVEIRMLGSETQPPPKSLPPASDRPAWPTPGWSLQSFLHRWRILGELG